VTSEAVGRYTAAEQMAMVRELKPEAVSLALRELCPDESSVAEAARFFGGLRGTGTWPQYIVYSPEELARFDALRRRGVFGEERPFCLLVLGRYTERLEGNLDELGAMRAAVDTDQFPWAVCCFGQHENAAMLEATRQGGHVRIGFENNLLLADGQLASNNSALIEQYARTSIDLGRRPASADDIREVWQL
ncbi:MAG: 3-keto-5-aminohexanoate cleavage protein, partial [Pseudomonadota bacterium]